ncbi:MAG: hypothetical protein HN590_08065 [Calditrichaeota bacterium]|jgi:indolepyruvate ferredoxin oxidoreductase, beta subunit|nr:hypothetical protein [Calditrichota bacterium]MBT7789595.1 hypothetical protein [Calditrichota bacterium]
MSNTSKMLIAGVGGQGVVYLINLLAEAALFADISVASSEIHGLAQRRGSVVAGITFGKNTYGYLEEAGADYLIGLEPLEAQRCISYLNKDSKAVIDNNQIFPHSVNSQKLTYPDVEQFTDYLDSNIGQLIYNPDFNLGMNPVLRNVFILGRAMSLEGFPVSDSAIEKAIESTTRANMFEDSLKAFKLGKNI